MSELSDLLGALPVPDHRQGFWEELETRLAQVDTESPAVTHIEPFRSVDAEIDDERSAPSKHRRRVGVAVLAAAAAVVAAVIGFSVVDDDAERAPVITENTTTTATTPTDEESQFDLRGRVRSIEVGPDLYALEAGPDTLWVRSLEALYRVDPRSDNIIARVDMPTFPPQAGGTEDFAVTDSGVWAVGGDGIINRINPTSNTIDAIIDIVPRFGADWDTSNRFIGEVAASSDAVWVLIDCSQMVCESNRLLRIDPASDKVVAEVDIPTHSDLVVDGDAVWLLDPFDVLHRVDPGRNEIVASIDLDLSIERDLVVDQGIGWLVGEFSVRRVDLTTGELSAQIRLFDPWDEQQIGEVGVSGGDLYVAEPRQAAPDFYRVDAQTNTVTELDLGLGSMFRLSLAVDAERLWFNGPGTTEVSYVALSDVENTTSPSAEDEATRAVEPEANTDQDAAADDASPEPPDPPFDASVLIDPFWQEAIANRSDITAQVSAPGVDLDLSPLEIISAMTSADGLVWLSTGNACPCQLLALDATTSEIVHRIPFDKRLGAPLAAHGAVYVSDETTVHRVDPVTAEVTATLGPPPDDQAYDQTWGGLAATDGAIWVERNQRDFAPLRAFVDRIDPDTLTVTATVDLRTSAITGPGFASGGLIVGTPGAIWVATGDTITRIDPATNAPTTTINVPDSTVTNLLADSDKVYVLARGLHRIDTTTNVFDTLFTSSGVGGGRTDFGYSTLTDDAVVISDGGGWLFSIETTANGGRSVSDIGYGSPGVQRLTTVDDEIWMIGAPDHALGIVPTDCLSATGC